MSENKNNNNNEVEELDINHLMQIRRDKLKELQEEGKDPFEITKFNRTNSAGEIKANYEQFEQKDVTVAGRIIAKRIMGKASFCTIQNDAFPIILFAIILPATVTSFCSNCS